MSRKDKVDEVVRKVLAPLLEKDGGTIRLVRLESDVLTIGLGGTLHGCPGTPYVKRAVIEPALRTAVGKDVRIVYERPAFGE